LISSRPPVLFPPPCSSFSPRCVLFLCPWSIEKGFLDGPPLSPSPPPLFRPDITAFGPLFFCLSTPSRVPRLQLHSFPFDSTFLDWSRLFRRREPFTDPIQFRSAGTQRQDCSFHVFPPLFFQCPHCILPLPPFIHQAFLISSYSCASPERGPGLAISAVVSFRRTTPLFLIPFPHPRTFPAGRRWLLDQLLYLSLRRSFAVVFFPISYRLESFLNPARKRMLPACRSREADSCAPPQLTPIMKTPFTYFP